MGELEPCQLVVVDDGFIYQHTLDLLAAVREAGTRVVTQANAGLSMARMVGLAATMAATSISWMPTIGPHRARWRLSPILSTRIPTPLRPGLRPYVWGPDCYFPTAPVLDPWRITYLCDIPGTCMVRRMAIEAVGGWKSEVGYEDGDFWT